MIKTDLVLPYGYTHDTVKDMISSHLPIRKDEIGEIRILKRELTVKDGAPPSYKSTIAFSSSIDKEEGLLKIRNKVYRFELENFVPKQSRFEKRPVVAGAGPAGLFAASMQ